MNGMKDGLSPLAARMKEVLRSQARVVPGDTILAAVSGGADSVALLLLLSELRDAVPFALVVAHYEHGIRGEASRGDARFVEALCNQLGIPCVIEHGDVPGMRAAWRCSMEDAARRARYAFLNETADKVGANHIALAHQLEDQAETLLLHLVHGAGVQGLSGMRAKQGRIIRPLLEISRQELETYLQGRGQPWREDATNADTAHARNLIRHEVMPLLRRLNPCVSEAMARTADLMAEAADSLRGQAEQALAGRTKQMPYGAFWQVGLEPVAKETVRLFAERTGVPPLDARQTAELVALDPGCSLNLPGDWHAFRTKERLHLVAPDGAVPAVKEDDFITQEAPAGFTGDGIRTQGFDADILEGAAFRFWQPGDVFAPLGSAGTQKLKKTFQDAGIDRPFRALLPLVAKGNRILWIVGLKAGRDAAVGPDTKCVIRMDYHGDLPWEITQHDGGQ